MTARLIDTATIEGTSWDFLTNPHDEYEVWRRGMVEDLWNDGEKLDWGVNPETQAAIRSRTDWTAGRFEVSAEDLHEDTLLYLAVRPERTAVDEPPVLAFRAGQVAARLAKPMASRAEREQSLETLLAAKLEDGGVTREEALVKLDRIIKACRYVAKVAGWNPSVGPLMIRIADSLQEVRDALQ